MLSQCVGMKSESLAVSCRAALSLCFFNCVRFCFLFLPLIANADNVKWKELSDISLSHTKSASTQRNIDAMSEQQSDLISEFSQVERRADVTESYNQQMAKLVRSQEQELQSLHEQIASIEETERAMLPLLAEMLASLAAFVQQDLPFLTDERANRLGKLEALLSRADVSVAEKYRQILEAYMVEIGYGRSIEAYSGTLVESEPAANGRHVNFFRMGRMSLYYQSLDGRESFLWSVTEKRWLALSDQQNRALSVALKVARQQQVPELLSLPVSQSMSHLSPSSKLASLTK